MSELHWTIDWSKATDARTESKPVDTAKMIENLMAAIDDRQPFRPFITEGQERDLRKIAEGEGWAAEAARLVLANPNLVVTKPL